MTETDWLTEQFESERGRLHAVAYRMLGSPSEADDAVQEAWIRLSRTGTDGIASLGGWLTTVVARICLDMLRSRGSRREDSLDDEDGNTRVADVAADGGPEHEALLADAVGLAMFVVLDTLGPAERVAFVLHDMFDVPFDAIAPIVGREPAATRQLASRARRRVRGAAADRDADIAGQRRVVEAFLSASREGNFAALLDVLDPDVVLRADAIAVAASRAGGPGSPQFEPERRGARAVAETFAGKAKAAQLALVGGAVGAAWAPGGVVRVAFAFRVADGKVRELSVVADGEQLGALAPVVLS